MKNLGDREVRDALKARIAALTAEDRRLWGFMDVQEMVRHARAAFPEWGLVEYDAGPEAPARKARALGAEARWPMIVREDARPEVAGDAVLFEGEKARLLEELERFVADAGARLGHPTFGAMTEDEWLRLAYLHTDHHLRQFGR